MQLIYSFSIYFYFLAIKIAALLGVKKAQQWITGRKNWKENLKGLNSTKQPLVWIHAASLGEFEQARPIIELLKKETDFYILLSFFSPSGYETRKDYQEADKVIYLPHDSIKNSKAFIEQVQPDVVLFIKYEFWFNYLDQLKKNNIPTYLVSGIFRREQHFFQFYGGWFRKKLNAFRYFFLQNEASEKLLQSIGFKNTSVIGDTRLDRVITVSQQSFGERRFLSFVENKKVLLFGSSWEKENDFAVQLNKDLPDLKIIIAPHEINEEKIASLAGKFQGRVTKLSDTQPEDDLSGTNILIIDSIGLLSKLYRFAYLSFIGGGYGKGIHNLPEAAVYGSPVFFGPNHHKFQEAKDLIRLGGGFSIASFQDFKNTLERFLAQPKKYNEASEAAKSYILSNSGASKKVFEEVKDHS